MITLDLSKAKLAEDLGSYKEKVAEIHDMIRNKTGAGNELLVKCRIRICLINLEKALDL